MGGVSIVYRRGYRVVVYIRLFAGVAIGEWIMHG